MHTKNMFKVQQIRELLARVEERWSPVLRCYDLDGFLGYVHKVEQVGEKIEVHLIIQERRRGYVTVSVDKIDLSSPTTGRKGLDMDLDIRGYVHCQPSYSSNGNA